MDKNVINNDVQMMTALSQFCYGHSFTCERGIVCFVFLNLKAIIIYLCFRKYHSEWSPEFSYFYLKIIDENKSLDSGILKSGIYLFYIYIYTNTYIYIYIIYYSLNLILHICSTSALLDGIGFFQA